MRLAASKPQLTCHEIPSTVFLLRKPDPFVIKQLNNLLPRLRPSVIQENDENEIFCHAKTSNANLRVLKREDWGSFLDLVRTVRGIVEPLLESAFSPRLCNAFSSLCFNISRRTVLTKYWESEHFFNYFDVER